MECVINGRFLGRTLTGVDRYAYGILHEIDRLLDLRDPLVDGLRFTVAVPSRVRARPFRNMSYETGPGTGYLWEQCVLPWMVGRRTLLNFCTVAPLVRTGYATIHDAHVWLVPEAFSRSFRLSQRILLPLIGHRAKRVVTVSRHSLNKLVEFHVAPAGAITIIPSAPNTFSRLDPGASRFAAAPPAEKYILMVGNDSPNKNMEMIVRLAPQLAERGIHICIVGPAGNPVFGRVGRDGGAQETVHRLGYVDDTDLAWLYGHALAFVFPSFEEGFGLPPLEAMSQGCPCVVSNTAAIPEVCSDAALYASPREPDAWLERIVQVDSDADLRTDLVMKGFERARYFTWEKNARLWLEMIRAGAEAGA